MFVLTPLLVGSHLLLIAESVPVFDLKKTCQGTDISAAFAGRTAGICIQSEEATRDLLQKSWGEFSAKDKAECVATAKIGGPPSYTELITCLEMRRDVQKLRAAPSDSDGDPAAGSRRKRQ